MKKIFLLLVVLFSISACVTTEGVSTTKDGVTTTGDSITSTTDSVTGATKYTSSSDNESKNWEYEKEAEKAPE